MTAVRCARHLRNHNIRNAWARIACSGDVDCLDSWHVRRMRVLPITAIMLLAMSSSALAVTENGPAPVQITACVVMMAGQLRTRSARPVSP